MSVDKKVTAKEVIISNAKVEQEKKAKEDKAIGEALRNKPVKEKKPLFGRKKTKDKTTDKEKQKEEMARRKAERKNAEIHYF